MRTKDRVRRYREKHPDATVRQIQAALRLSSPSVVQFHLTQNSKQDEVKALRDENKLLRAQIGNIESAWRDLWEKAGRPAGVPKL